MALEFNRQLKDRVQQLRHELPQAALTYVDVYSAKYVLIGAAKEQGIQNPKGDFQEKYSCCMILCFQKLEGIMGS